jgi:Sec-independent protein secretion pathway component TatC
MSYLSNLINLTYPFSLFFNFPFVATLSCNMALSLGESINLFEAN